MCLDVRLVGGLSIGGLPIRGLPIRGLPIGGLPICLEPVALDVLFGLGGFFRFAPLVLHDSSFR